MHTHAYIHTKIYIYMYIYRYRQASLVGVILEQLTLWVSRQFKKLFIFKLGLNVEVPNMIKVLRNYIQSQEYDLVLRGSVLIPVYWFSLTVDTQKKNKGRKQRCLAGSCSKQDTLGWTVKTLSFFIINARITTWPILKISSYPLSFVFS